MNEQKDREIEIIDKIFTPTARFLFWIHEKGGEVTKTEARSMFGNNFYTHAYRLALLGFIDINKNIKITEEGKKIVECIKKCL